nr:MAG TPA: hypothetical protein [Caudoviricetes sp.]
MYYNSVFRCTIFLKQNEKFHNLRFCIHNMSLFLLYFY